MKKFLQMLIFCFILPVSFNYFCYYGYVSQYTGSGWGFSDKLFREQYDTGVYKYRILGKALLLGIFERLEQFNPRDGTPKLLAFFNAETLNLYHSYYILNTIFFCLTMFSLFFIYELPCFRLSHEEENHRLFFIAALIAISEFVVTPYDMMSYFFICTGMYFILQPSSPRNLAVLALLMLIATITRENSALLISFSITMFAIQKEYAVRKTASEFLILLSTFIASYLGLRLVLGFESAFYNGSPFSALVFNANDALPLLFVASIFWLITDFSDPIRKKAFEILLLTTSPYILSIFSAGILLEIRLWIPLILMTLVLNQRSLGSRHTDSDKA